MPNEQPYIGVIDLSVRLTSMNPLGSLDLVEANNEFEEALFFACEDTYARSRNKDDLRTKGIIRKGTTPRYFELDSAVDALNFCDVLRKQLFELGLPFKLCLSRGHLGGKVLTDEWSETVEVLKSVGDYDIAAQENSKIESLGQKFRRRTAESIDLILDLYKTGGLDSDAELLSLHLENFKGFGIYSTDTFSTGNLSYKTIINHHVSQSSGRIEYKPYFDLSVERAHGETITVKDGKRSFREPTGIDTVIEKVLDLSRRAKKANTDNIQYFVTAINSIILSSDFSKIRYVDKTLKENDGEFSDLAEGWQLYPPVFHRLIIDPIDRSVFGRGKGTEIIAGSLVDQVFRGIALDIYGQSSHDDMQKSGSLTHNERTKFVHHARFAEARVLMKNIETVFGKTIVSKIIKLPDSAISSLCKKMALLSSSHQ